ACIDHRQIIMAILGFHIVVSLIVLTVLSKIGSRASFLKILVSSLVRYIAPSNDELRALLPPVVETRAKQRRKRKEEEDANGFNVPRQLPFTLKKAYVRVEELEKFPLYSSIHWICLFVPAALFVFVLSDLFLLWNPTSSDMNTSFIWLIVGLAFCLQILARLTALLLSGEDEKSLLFSLSILIFFALFVFTVFVDRIFDISLLDAYTHLRTVAAEMANEEVAIKPESPLLLYISLVVLYTTIGCSLIFPSLRFATMFQGAYANADPFGKVVLPSVVLIPLVTIVSFSHPFRLYMTEGRRVWMTMEQLQVLRINLCLVWCFLRLCFFRQFLQVHLDLAYDKVVALQRQSGKIRNIQLQSMIFQYYSYLCPAIAQFLIPIALVLFLSLLLKGTTGLAFVGESSAIAETTSNIASLSTVFNTTVCRSMFSFSLLSIVMLDFGLSLVGLVYNSYFIRTV
ncbi:hypothetical protein PFISCL1PPCAC_19661, partial [Pristionchus fissidentatus]